jgi:hypothetical protein
LFAEPLPEMMRLEAKRWNQLGNAAWLAMGGGLHEVGCGDGEVVL